MSEVIFDNIQVQAAIQSLTDWIVLNHREHIIDGSLVVVGIETGGKQLQKRILEILTTHFGSEVTLHEGSLNITMYRDDLYTGLEKPILGVSHIPVSIKDKNIILIDDVLFTGRTVRAALQELLDYGRPKKIELLVLLDRGGRELPIQPNFSALSYNVPNRVKIKVVLQDSTSKKTKSDHISIKDRNI
jgi:pyrimidine operon attenuation protein / uracil phosphoribosyltransferase